MVAAVCDTTDSIQEDVQDEESPAPPTSGGFDFHDFSSFLHVSSNVRTSEQNLMFFRMKMNRYAALS